jgi:hypothetical protein
MLSETYRNRLKILSGILKEERENSKNNKIDWEYQLRDVGGPIFYKRKKGDKNWMFTSAEEFAQGISEGGKLIRWKDEK